MQEVLDPAYKDLIGLFFFLQQQSMSTILDLFEMLIESKKEAVLGHYNL